MVAHERLTKPRVTIEGLLEKPSSFSNLPAFLDLHGMKSDFTNMQTQLILFINYDGQQYKI